VRRFAVTAPDPWAVTADDVQGWYETLRRSGWADNTVRVHRSSLRAFYLWALREGHNATNPADEPTRRGGYRDAPEAWVAPLAGYRRYLRGVGRTEGTVRTRSDAVRRFARENPSLTPWAVTFDDLVTWLGGKRWAGETRKLHRDALRSFYGWAKSAGHTRRNPAKRIPPIRAHAQIPRPVIDAVYRDALARADSRERLALRLAAELGMRRAEVAQVHSRDVLPSAGGRWALLVHGKGAKDRQLPLTTSLATALRSQPEGYVFPGGDRGHISPDWMGRTISGLLPPGVSMHALRHRFATAAYNVNRDVFTVQRLLGHASPATTQRYVQVSDDRMRAVVEAVAR